MKKFVTFGETMVQYNADYQGDYVSGGSHIKDVAGAESVDPEQRVIPGMQVDSSIDVVFFFFKRPKIFLFSCKDRRDRPRRQDLTECELFR